MKTPKRVKIVASAPGEGQVGIPEFIGKEFTVIRGTFKEKSKQLSVETEEGVIVLQPAEYETLES